MKHTACIDGRSGLVLIPVELGRIAAVALRQVALQVAGIVQDPRHFDDPFVAAAVQQ